MYAGLLLPLGSLPAAPSASDWVDLGCAVAALTSIGLGARRGLSAELPLGVGWFCGIAAAWFTYGPAHACFRDLSFMEDQPEFLFMLTAVTVILLAWGVAALVSRGLRVLAVNVEKTPFDYILGTVVGVIRILVLLTLVTAFMMGQGVWPRGQEVFCRQSRAGKMFAPWAANLLSTVKQAVPHVEIHRRNDDPGDIIHQAK